MHRILAVRLLGGLLLALQGHGATPPAVFRVGTYNLENYLDAPTESRPAKSPQAKAKIRESLRQMRADVLALQEIGRSSALEELRLSLKAEGLDYPYWEHVSAYDTNISVAVLSQFPIVARRPHTNEAFLLYGRRFRVSRGFAEVDIRVTPHYRFTLMTAHLKSRRPVYYGDQAELREQEALLLREKIEALLMGRPQANLVVLGDFNDTKDSKTIRRLLGRGANGLIDTRPAERNGDDPTAPESRSHPRAITWTHYYGQEDSYSRIDYILISRGMAREWIQAQTAVLAMPNWGNGSDHRPIVAAFAMEDR